MNNQDPWAWTNEQPQQRAVGNTLPPMQQEQAPPVHQAGLMKGEPGLTEQIGGMAKNRAMGKAEKYVENKLPTFGRDAAGRGPLGQVAQGAGPMGPVPIENAGTSVGTTFNGAAVPNSTSVASAIQTEEIAALPQTLSAPLGAEALGAEALSAAALPTAEAGLAAAAPIAEAVGSAATAAAPEALSALGGLGGMGTAAAELMGGPVGWALAGYSLGKTFKLW